jgi:hypothetical protein
LISSGVPRIKRKVLFSAALSVLLLTPLRAQWSPPETLSRQEIVETSQALLAAPEVKLKTWEDLFRIQGSGEVNSQCPV